MHPSLIDSCFSILVVNKIVICLLPDDSLDQVKSLMIKVLWYLMIKENFIEKTVLQWTLEEE